LAAAGLGTSFFLERTSWGLFVTLRSTIEINNLPIEARIGFFEADPLAPNDHNDPYRHVLDLVLVVSAELVLVEHDAMAHVFDYDPLVAQIHALATERHYETQEMLLTRIVNACASHSELIALDICLKKYQRQPSHPSENGYIGVRLSVSQEALTALRRDQ